MLKMKKVSKFSFFAFALFFWAQANAESKPSVDITKTASSTNLPVSPEVETVTNGINANMESDAESGASGRPLTKINGMISILKAELELEKIQWQLKKARQGEFGESPQAGFSTQTPLPAPPQYQGKDEKVALADPLPVLLGVYGAKGKLQASLRLSNGNVVQVSQGDALPNGFRVNTVLLNKVTVIKNGQVFNIGS